MPGPGASGWSASYNRSAEARRGRYEQNEKQIRGHIAEINSRLEKMVRDNGGAIGLPSEYYTLQGQRQELESQLRGLTRPAASTSTAASAQSRTFVNGYGEATRREITSGTYRSAQRRLTRDVENFLGVKRR